MKISPETDKKIEAWLFSDDGGMSSRFLAAVTLDLPPDIIARRMAHPYDPSDFGRCYRFMQLLTKEEQAATLSEAAKLDPHWGAIMENWDKLETLYLEECVGEQWRAPKLYEFMKKIGL